MTDDSDLADTYVYFGPGVPMPPAPDHATAVWRGEVAAEEPREDRALATRRRNQRWILPLTVLILVIAIVIYYLWGRNGTRLAVSSVSVRTSATSLSCGQTERLTGVFTTNGGGGTITYQWLRSDGTESDRLTQTVDSGSRQASVVLAWNFDGYGEFDATATLRVLSPGGAEADARFTYGCAKPSPQGAG